MQAIDSASLGVPRGAGAGQLPDPHPAAGQVRIAVRAAGINPIDWKVRSGAMGGDLPQTTGREVAGRRRRGRRRGDRRQARRRGLRLCRGRRWRGAAARCPSEYAPIPPSLDFAAAAALPVAVETAVRTLDAARRRIGHYGADQRRSRRGGQCGRPDRAGARRACDRHGEREQPRLPALARQPSRPPTARACEQRVRELAPDGVDAALDAAGAGALPALVELTGSPDRVVTIADFLGAQETGVDLQRRDGDGSRRARPQRDRRPDRGRRVLAAASR